MFLDFIRRYLPPDNVPNRFTIAMGELIRNARQDARLTQKELAEGAYIPQSTLSKMENGKIEPSASELVYLSSVLKKPITFFFPNELIRQFNLKDHNDELLNELLLVGSKLNDDDLKKVIAQIRVLVMLNQNGNGIKYN